MINWQPMPSLVYIGTYTGPKSKGIYLFRLQTENREVPQNITLVPLGVATETPSPSFLAVDMGRHLLFAVNEIDSFEGRASGAVSAFQIDPGTGKLTAINQRPSMGTGPCHLALDHFRKNLVVANYNSGSVAVLPISADGHLGEASDVVQHSGSSVNPDRQKGPHAHCITFDPAYRFVFVCDLGLDKIMAYRLDEGKGKLTPGDPPFTPVKAGAGPRHMAFRPDGRFAYVINELNSTVTTFGYMTSTGRLHEIATVSSLPPHFEGNNSGAELTVHPSGRFLYASNRGNDTVVLFAIDPSKGTLTYVDEQGSGGKTPRHFGIDASAKYMVICNQNSDNMLACAIDGATGRLKPSGVLASAPSPVCALFVAQADGGKR
jgi:6-phosphogluconolactonase